MYNMVIVCTYAQAVLSAQFSERAELLQKQPTN